MPIDIKFIHLIIKFYGKIISKIYKYDAYRSNEPWEIIKETNDLNIIKIACTTL